MRGSGEGCHHGKGRISAVSGFAVVKGKSTGMRVFREMLLFALAVGRSALCMM